MKYFSLPTNRFRRRVCLIMVSMVILTFINLLLCTWKDIYWQEEDLELKITYLWKRRKFTPTLSTKTALQSKVTQQTLHYSSLQSWTKQKTPKPTTRTIPHSTVPAQKEKSSNAAYHTRLRKQSHTPSIKESNEVIARTQTVPEKNQLERKVRKLI